MEENTPASQHASGKKAEANGKRFTPSQRTAHIPPSTISSSEMLYPLTESEKENATLAAGILTSTVSTLIKAGYVRAGKNQNGEIVLIFPSTVWTDKLRLK